MQQRFWPDPQPLVERLGRDFFRNLPEGPGVYQMRAATNAVLYIGKAKNLRHRLGSYRVANPERMARRTLRLLKQAESITWEECSDEAAALRRESELLLQLKPRFNRAGVWQGPKRFLASRRHELGLELAILDIVEPEWCSFGIFGAQARHLLGALVRLVWSQLHPEAGLAGMPSGWFRGAYGTRVIVPHSNQRMIAEAAERLAFLAKGDGEKLLEWFAPVTFRFEQPMRDEDLELVTKHLVTRSAEKAMIKMDISGMAK